MAYMLEGRQGYKGPYPNLAGEYCGNRRAKDPIDETLWRRGRPQACAAGSAEQMEAYGFCGLYLTVDVKPFPDGFEPDDGPITYIPTPDSLREPEPA
jgi:hypothetical protein